MALTFAADAEVFLDINVHNNNIFFVFLDFVRFSLVVAAALSGHFQLNLSSLPFLRIPKLILLNDSTVVDPPFQILLARIRVKTDLWN